MVRYAPTVAVPWSTAWGVWETWIPRAVAASISTEETLAGVYQAKERGWGARPRES